MRIRDTKEPQQGRTPFVEDNLLQAESLIESGQLLDARRILTSIISLYDRNREMKPLVNRAREKIRQLDTGEQDSGAGK